MTMTAADICRERGWGKGTLLCEEYRHYDGEHWCKTYYRLTAVGEVKCLGVSLGAEDDGDERPRQWERSEDTVEIYESNHLHEGVKWGTTWHAIPHLPWETPDLPPKCNHCKQPGSIDHAGLCETCGWALSEFNRKRYGAEPAKEAT